jgi:transposase
MMPMRTLQTFIKQFKEDGTYKGNISTKRPKKLGERDLLRVLLFSRTHHRPSLQDITNDCPMEVNTSSYVSVIGFCKMIL